MKALGKTEFPCWQRKFIDELYIKAKLKCQKYVKECFQLSARAWEIPAEVKSRHQNFRILFLG